MNLIGQLMFISCGRGKTVNVKVLVMSHAIYSLPFQILMDYKDQKIHNLHLLQAVHCGNHFVLIP